MKYLNLTLLTFLSISALSQVESGEKIVLSSVDSSQRTITGIAYPLAGTNAANTGSVENGSLIYSSAAGINALSLNLLPAVSGYVQGMVINFKTTSSNTGPVTIQLNGLAPVDLKKNGIRAIDSLDFAPGQMVTALYDGTFFQVISRLNRRCPPGFTDVNKDYCIELVERDTVNWFQATKACGNINARLCSFSEWAYACTQSATLGLVGMINNLEWIDSAGNSADQCKTMGNDGTISACNAGVTAVWSYKAYFRCCYSK